MRTCLICSGPIVQSYGTSTMNVCSEECGTKLKRLREVQQSQRRQEEHEWSKACDDKEKELHDSIAKKELISREVEIMRKNGYQEKTILLVLQEHHGISEIPR